MSQDNVKREPQAAYCEDYYEDDDEDEIATPLANVAVKRTDAATTITKRASYERRRNDGSDSGYSSRTNTNTSTSSVRRDMADLKIDTATERRPQPYAFVQRPDQLPRTPSENQRDVAGPAVSKSQYYVHKEGECYVCDTWGEHLPENLRPSKAAAVPASPKTTKKKQEHPVKREEAAPRLRRESSARNPRPVSMYAPNMHQFNYQPTLPPHVLQYAAPMPTGGWTTPLSPTMQYSPFAYTPTVMTATYVTEPSYFEQPPRDNRPSKRSSMHGDVVIRQSKPETRPTESQKTSSTRDHDRSNSDRTVRAAADYDNMPPPPRPAVTLAHRPSIKKSATYNTAGPPHTNRRSQVIDDDDAAYVTATTAPSLSRDRRVEPSLPPSSYRHPSDTSDARPVTRKSVSYSVPSGTTKVSSSIQPASTTALPRRQTTTATPAESRKLVDAEEYQAQRRSLTSNDLTAEALRNLKPRNPSTRSETSSHRSHHTKSSSSAGGKSKRSNSDIKMIINGLHVSIPTSAAEQNISISTRRDGDISISLGGGGRDRDRDYEISHPPSHTQKRIEKAPSATSRTSRMSSRSVGEKERARERVRESEEMYERIRRQSATSRSRSRVEEVRRVYDHDRGSESPNPWDN